MLWSADSGPLRSQPGEIGHKLLILRCGDGLTRPTIYCGCCCGRSHGPTRQHPGHLLAAPGYHRGVALVAPGRSGGQVVAPPPVRQWWDGSGGAARAACTVAGPPMPGLGAEQGSARHPLSAIDTANRISDLR